MAKFNELPTRAQIGIVVGVALALTAALYFGYFKAIDDENRQTLARVEQLELENQGLEQYAMRLTELNAQIENLKIQLDRQKQIVPDEKEAPGFMHIVQAQAQAAGIEIRRYTARPTSTREYFTEVPFEMELDGSYYAMLNFFERVAKVERIINIAELKMATVQKPGEAKAKRKYLYAPTESVVATVVATTFFSHDNTAPAKPATGTAAAAQPRQQ